MFILVIRFVVKNTFQETRFFEQNIVQETTLLKKYIPPNTPVFFYNTPSNYMIGAELIPTKPWADTFSWYLEVPGMQEAIIAFLEKNQTRVIIFQPFQGNETTMLGSYIPQKIDEYVSVYYPNRMNIASNLWLLQRSSSQ